MAGDLVTKPADSAAAKPAPKATKKNFFRKYLAVWIVLLVGAIALICVFVSNAQPLDEILLYEVDAQVLPSGALINTYHIQWKVLNDSREGPLSWVDIGMPNANFAVVSNSGAAYDAYNSGDSYIEVYLDRPYYKDEIADFTFTVNQCGMLCYSDQGTGQYMIDFAPGWFPKIKVDSYRFSMSPAELAAGGNQDGTEDGALIWTGSLNPNGHREMKVYFPASAFDSPSPVVWQPIDYSVSMDNGTNGSGSDIIIVPIIFIAIGILVIKAVMTGGYRGGRGFYGGGYIGGGFHGGGGGCACACAGCACACACAGGGRAGCNTKGFYRAKTDETIK